MQAETDALPFLVDGKKRERFTDNFQSTLNRMDSKSVDLNKIVEVNDEEEFRHNTNEKELTIETPEKKNMEKSRIVQKKLDKKEKINKIRNTVCKKPIEVNLECKECGYKGQSQRSMRIHKRDNTHKKSLKCNECNIEVQTEKKTEVP